MGGIGDELLAQSEHLQRMMLDAPERRSRAIYQHALRCLSDPQGGRIAQPVARQALDMQGQFSVLDDVDVDRSNRATNDPNAAIGPS
jgi:hypothetical protein